MHNQNLETYLCQKINLDTEIIKSLFAKNKENEFEIALILNSEYGIAKAELGKIWGSYFGLAYVDPNTSIINDEYIKKTGVDFIIKNKALPLYKFGKAVTVTTSDPTNPYLQDKLERRLEEIVSLVFCFPFDIENYLLINGYINAKSLKI